jgi:hypothetical protein
MQMIRERLPSLLCQIAGHRWRPFGRPTSSRGTTVTMRQCARCHRITIERQEAYPEILPAPPWSEAEARAALLLGTAVMDLPVLGPVQGAGMPPRDPLSALETGVDAVLWFDPTTDEWKLRSSSSITANVAAGVDELLTSLPNRSLTWHD